MKIVSTQPPSGPQPPRALGNHGQNLWNRVLAEYHITDVAGVEMLFQACAATDRCEALAAQIEADGGVISTRTGLRSHPAIKDELALRGFIVRTLHKLGLDVEPLRSGPGKPPGTFGGGRPLKGVG